MQIIAESDIGFVGFEGNELTIGSKIDDPPKVRLTAPCTEHGGGGGVISFNYSRSGGVVCDGHQVDRPFDKSANPKALWSAWTGKLG